MVDNLSVDGFITVEERIESLETAVKSMQEALEKLKQFVGYKE